MWSIWFHYIQKYICAFHCSQSRARASCVQAVGSAYQNSMFATETVTVMILLTSCSVTGEIPHVSRKQLNEIMKINFRSMSNNVYYAVKA